MDGHPSRRPIDPRLYRPEMPPLLGTLILACLGKSPEERPQRVADLSRALRRVQLDLQRKTRRARTAF